MTPVAMIPMYTPEEAIVELEYAVKTLGLKVAMMPSLRAASDSRGRRARGEPRRTPNGSTCWRSTASTTTTRCGRSASS